MSFPNPATQFKPGQSGNPSGRPKKIYKDALDQLIAEVGLTAAVRALYNKACEGDVGALKELADRIDGKVPTPTGGTDELPPVAHTLRIETVIVDPNNSNGDGAGVPAAPDTSTV